MAVGSERQSGSFLEQDSTAVPKFAYRSFCPCGNLVGECLPQTLLMRLTPLENQQYGFSSPEELDEACSAAYTAMRESLTELKQMEKTLNGKKELQRQVLAYSKTRPVRDGLKQQKNAKAKAAYRQKYESDFIIADAAARYFRENGISKLPSYKSLQAEIESLIKEKNSGYNDYRAKREEYRRLQTVKGNIDQILRRSEPQRRKEQSHER